MAAEPRSVAPNTSAETATLQGVFVFAQLSTSVSDDQIRLIIIALLVVAVLLAILTIWYFVKTSPSRRVRAAQARRQTTAPRQGGAAAGAASATAAGAARAGTSRSGGEGVIRPDDVVIDVDDGDEWDRLTAPEPRRPASN